MRDLLETTREFASQWREANGRRGEGGVVIVIDGLFVGWTAELPPPEHWAPGCLAVAEDATVHFARPAGFRGEVEWIDLGRPPPPESSGPPPLPLQNPAPNDDLP